MSYSLIFHNDNLVTTVDGYLPRLSTFPPLFQRQHLSMLPVTNWTYDIPIYNLNPASHLNVLNNYLLNRNHELITSRYPLIFPNNLINHIQLVNGQWVLNYNGIRKVHKYIKTGNPYTDQHDTPILKIKSLANNPPQIIPDPNNPGRELLVDPNTGIKKQIKKPWEPATETIRWHKKYLKYKHKYLALKKKLSEQ